MKSNGSLRETWTPGRASLECCYPRVRDLGLREIQRPELLEPFQLHQPSVCYPGLANVQRLQAFEFGCDTKSRVQVQCAGDSVTLPVVPPTVSYSDLRLW